MDKQISEVTSTISRRKLLGAVGTGLTIGAAGCLGSPSDISGKSVPNNVVTNAPLPSNPGEYKYAVMGKSDAPVTVTYYGNWKCPYCADFSSGFLKTLVSDYVQPGDIQIEYRCLAYFDGQPFLGPDAPRAGRAGLAVWNLDPEKYWTFHEYIFKHQPPESQRWATTDALVGAMEAVGVSGVGQARKWLNGDKFQSALEKTADRASQLGISGTPHLVVDGSVVSPFKKQQTRQAIENALNK